MSVSDDDMNTEENEEQTTIAKPLGSKLSPETLIQAFLQQDDQRIAQSDLEKMRVQIENEEIKILFDKERFKELKEKGMEANYFCALLCCITSKTFKSSELREKCIIYAINELKSGSFNDTDMRKLIEHIHLNIKNLSEINSKKCVIEIMRDLFEYTNSFEKLLGCSKAFELIGPITARGRFVNYMHDNYNHN